MHCPGCQLDQEWCVLHGDGVRDVWKVTDAARSMMRSQLRELPRRRAHSEAVARAMDGLYSPVHPSVRDEARAAGLLHDIGYGTVDTGLHSLDGALVLRGTTLEFLAPLVAWHSTAAPESAARGIPIEVPQPSDATMRAALWVADFSTSPDGNRVRPADRIADIRSRYTPDSPVIAALDAAMPDFVDTLRLWGLHDQADPVEAAGA